MPGADISIECLSVESTAEGALLSVGQRLVAGEDALPGVAGSVP
jgi:hypothetical protein